MHRIPSYTLNGTGTFPLLGCSCINCSHIHADDERDFMLMRELMNPRLPKATSTPITLATIGLEQNEVKRIARERREEKALQPFRL